MEWFYTKEFEGYAPPMAKIENVPKSGSNLICQNVFGETCTGVTCTYAPWVVRWAYLPELPYPVYRRATAEDSSMEVLVAYGGDVKRGWLYGAHKNEPEKFVVGIGEGSRAEVGCRSHVYVKVDPPEWLAMLKAGKEVSYKDTGLEVLETAVAAMEPEALAIHLDRVDSETIMVVDSGWDGGGMYTADPMGGMVAGRDQWGGSMTFQISPEQAVEMMQPIKLIPEGEAYGIEQWIKDALDEDARYSESRKRTGDIISDS